MIADFEDGYLDESWFWNDHERGWYVSESNAWGGYYSIQNEDIDDNEMAAFDIDLGMLIGDASGSLSFMM